MSAQGDTRNILLIDDEKNLRESLAEFLSLDGFICMCAKDGEEGLSFLEKQVFDAVVLDLRMPGLDGLTVLSKIHDFLSDVPVIMMSAHGEIHDAVEAMKRGAIDYLVKPFDPAELALRLENAVADKRLRQHSHVEQRLSGEDDLSDETRPWFGNDKQMCKLYDILKRVAPTASTVLITGESGTGKEVIAREIHRQSPRAASPFVPINVGAIPESLLESELFGHEKGAFTGAVSRRIGYFELASGGTLFLDELAEMPLSMQVKLLRVLQDRLIMRVGGTRAIPVNVRIIGATNKDIEDYVEKKLFREDLYFRLNVIRLTLPPLRERVSDITPLAKRFLNRFAQETGKAVKVFSPETIQILCKYPFPGNIRELENIIERAVILAQSDVISPEDLLLDRSKSVQSETMGAKDDSTKIQSENSSLSIRELEKQAVVVALARNGGHRERTASDLGISRRTLLTKMKEYGLLRKDGLE